MEELTYICSYFERSATINHQGTRASIQRYLKDGFSIKQDRNGFWVLTKPSRAWFTFKNSSGELVRFDMRGKIMLHYGKQKFYEATYKRFVKELSDGTVKVCLDESNNCVIV